MTTVNIAKLKAELSKYIKLAEGGEEIIVTDHRQPVVKLVPIEKEQKPRLQIIKAVRPISDLSNLPLPDRIQGVDVVQILMEDRDAR